jgi:hypothetical protein
VLTAIDDVLFYGGEKIIPFRIEECTKCIWYNSAGASETPPEHRLEVVYKTANEYFSTPIPWTGNIDDSDPGESSCNDDYLVGPKTCTLEISHLEVKVTC